MFTSNGRTDGQTGFTSHLNLKTAERATYRSCHRYYMYCFSVLVVQVLYALEVLMLQLSRRNHSLAFMTASSDLLETALKQPSSSS